MSLAVGRQEEPNPETHTPSHPPSPSSYILPLLLVIALCVGFLAWRWRRRRQQPMHRAGLGPAPTAVRLSTEDDGPAAHSFLVNNASTDSLPSHALTDLPTFPELSRGPSPKPDIDSRYGGAHPSQPPIASNGKGKGKGREGKRALHSSRRSARITGPIEDDDNDSDEGFKVAESSGQGSEHGKNAGGQIFDIGDEDSETESGGIHNGPLRAKR